MRVLQADRQTDSGPRQTQTASDTQWKHIQWYCLYGIHIPRTMLDFDRRQSLSTFGYFGPFCERLKVSFGDMGNVGDVGILQETSGDPMGNVVALLDPSGRPVCDVGHEDFLFTWLDNRLPLI